MRLIVMLCVLVFSCLPNANAANVKAKQKTTAKKVDIRDMQRYVFTWEQIAKLTPDQQVAYYKFLVKFITTLEEAQPEMDPKYRAKKSAILEMFEKLGKQLNPEAYAAGYSQSGDASMVGKLCIYGAHTSTYREYSYGGGSSYWCNPIDGSSCPSGQSECNAALFNFMNPKGTGGPLCVNTVPLNESPEGRCLTARCVTAFEERLGGRFSDVVKQEMANAANNKAKQKEWNDYVSTMKKAVNDVESNPVGGVTLREYCKQSGDGRYNDMNFNKQHYECEALYRLFADINGSNIPVPPPAPTPGPVIIKPNPDIYAKCHNDQTHPELGDLACVNCAIREAGPGSTGDASKWITLLAMTAGSVQKNEAGDSTKNRVIKMLLSTSYCTDDEYPNDPGFNAQAASGFPAGIYKNYGLEKDYDLKNLLGDYQNNDAKGFPWNFEGINIFYRRARYGYFFSKAGSHSHYSGGLKSCLSKASNRLQNNPAFNYCAPNDFELNNPAGFGPTSTNQADLTALMSFCNNLVNACDGTDKSICLKSNLIGANPALNEKERRTQGDMNKQGTAPRLGYYSQNFEMSGNMARCPRREASSGSDGTAGSTSSNSSTGPSSASPGPSGPGTGSH